MSKETIKMLFEPIEVALCVVDVISIGFRSSVLFYVLLLILETGYVVFMRRYYSKEEFPSERIVFYGKIFIVCFVAGFIYSLFFLMQSDIGIDRSKMAVMPVAIFTGLTAYGIYYDGQTKTKAAIEVLDSIVTEEEKKGNMDVVLCRDNESRKPVAWLEVDRYLHLLLIGATGAGKTSQVLIPLLYQDIQKDNRSIIVLEPKGDLAEKTYAMATLMGKKAMYFNPVHPDCPSFNPFYGEEDVVVENMCRIFTALNKSNNMYFQVMAENLLRYGLMVLKRLEKASINPKTGIPTKPATMVRFSNLIHNSNAEGVKMVTEFKKISNITALERKQNADIAAWFLDDYFVVNSKTYENTSIVRAQFVRLTSNKYLRKVLNPESGQSDIRFDQILEDDIVLAIGTAQGLLQQLGAYLGYFIMLSYQAAVLRRGGTEATRKPNIFVCDEFQKYADIGFSDVLTQGRSYRVSAILATQSRKQITMNMDAHEGAAFLEVVSTNARNVILFPGASIDDVEYFSKKFGTVRRKQVSYSKSRPNMGFFHMAGLNGGSNSESEREVEEAEHSVDSLEFKDFGQISYQLVKRNTLQRAREGTVEWIPRDINDKIDYLVSLYAEEQNKKAEEILEKEKEEMEKRNDMTKMPYHMQSFGGVVDPLD